MSLTGQQRLQLEARRREELRLSLVRTECSALDAACEQALKGVRDIAIQQLAAAELREAAQRRAAARAVIAARPDEALTALREVQAAIHSAITRGEAAARAWSVAQTETIGKARALVGQATAVDASSGEGVATRRATEALRRAEAGDVEGARSLLPEAATAIVQQRATILDESIRREVVVGLLATLKSMGFVAQPMLDGGVVVLDGRLPSGRRAHFEVSLDGKMDFDLDGYEGRACKDDFDKIETVLRDTYGVKLGPPQIEWKNPDRLSRGAQSLPKTSPNKQGA